MKHQVPESMKFKKLLRRLGCPRVTLVGTLELLWIAVQTNTPEGDIGRFTNEEIAVVCEWGGDPDVLVEALVEAGWLDECAVNRLVVHDWPEHCPGWVKRQLARHKRSFVTVSSLLPVTDDERGTVSSLLPVTDDSQEATPNQTKPNQTKPNPTKRTPGKPGSPPSASVPALTLAEVVEKFNSDQGQSARETKARKAAFGQRIRDPFWVQNWRAASERAAVIPFYQGGGSRGWVITLDFFLKPDSVTKIMENGDKPKSLPRGSVVPDDGESDPLEGFR